MERYFLGIDGGQSSTTALIANSQGLVIGSGVDGPCNHVSASAAAARFSRVVSGCLENACKTAGLEASTLQFESAVCGMSGGPDDKVALLQSLIRAKHLRITDDGLIALSGALEGGPGVIVIGGTGSIAYGRGFDDRVGRVGGWGYIFGDEGGAFDIARQALRAVLRFHEGWGPATSLLEPMLNATGAENANKLLHLFYTSEWPRSRVAELSELVDAVAKSGDSVARRILEQAAQNLALLAGSVRSQLFEHGSETRVSYIGGVFRSRVLLKRFQQLVELSDECRCIAPIMKPAAGALLEAFRAAGISTVTLVNLEAHT